MEYLVTMLSWKAQTFARLGKKCYYKRQKRGDFFTKFEGVRRRLWCGGWVFLTLWGLGTPDTNHPH